MQLNDKEYLLDMTTPQLSELLRSEVCKEAPDAELIRSVMDILDERNREAVNEIPIDGEEAWAQYKASKAADAWNKKRKTRNRILRWTAAAAAVCILVFAAPKAAKADNFFEMVARWTEDVVRFFTAGSEGGGQADYRFKTDNPDLQAVYDAVVAMGVTEPAVPMWLPETCQLIEIKDMSGPKRARTHARFSMGESEATITVDLYKAGMSFELPKNEEKYGDYECDGMTHCISKNNEVWTVIWEKDAMVCCITIECPEDTLYQIIDSIYTTEAD